MHTVVTAAASKPSIPRERLEKRRRLEDSNVFEYEIADNEWISGDEMARRYPAHLQCLGILEETKKQLWFTQPASTADKPTFLSNAMETLVAAYMEEKSCAFCAYRQCLN